MKPDNVLKALLLSYYMYTNSVASSGRELERQAGTDPSEDSKQVFHLRCCVALG